MPNERDLVFEALCEVCGADWRQITSDQRGRVNAARKQLRDIYGEIETLPAMIRERAAAFRVCYPEIPVTPQGLTGNWSSVVENATRIQDQAARLKAEKRQVTNAHMKRGCVTCGDDHFVSVGYDKDGYEQTAPCPDCGPDASFWVQRRKVEVMDPAKTREMMDR